MSQMLLIKRQDVPLEYTWKLEDIFSSDQAAQEALLKVKKDSEFLLCYKGRVIDSAKNLLYVLTQSDQLSALCEKIYTYSHMRLHQDGNNTFYQDLSSKSESSLVQLSSNLAFINPELSLLTEETLSHFFEQEDKLTLYKRYLQEILRQKMHILDNETEKLLSQAAEIATMPNNTYSVLSDIDIKFPSIQDGLGHSVPLTHGRFIQFLENSNRQVRHDAFIAMYTTYGDFKNTFATLFASNVKQYGFFSRARHFKSPLHSALNANNIPLSVYNNLITTVNNHLDLMHHYILLRKNCLGLTDLHMYDLFTPMVEGFNKKIRYEEACDIILKALEPLGDDYVKLVKEGFENRWVDRYENAGKRSGAYSWGTYDSPHPYVLMNYVDNINSMFTLAHEMGHALHSYMSSHTQPYPYAGYCIFVAEVASTVNEALLMQYLLKTVTEPLYRKYLINYFMEQFRTTLFRQTMFAEFEKMVHLEAELGNTLTSDLLCEKYYSLVKKYHGDSICVDAEIALEWARIPHFYTPFYVYQYATGYSAAIALSQHILNDGPEATLNYKKFLSGGSSKDPIDLLKIAGVDMSSPQPIENALKVFSSLIEEFKHF